MAEYMKNGKYILVKAPDWYRGKRYRGKYCYEHHLVWEKETGCPVPKGCIIHHKDGNKFNNDIKNLQLMDSIEHNRMHSSVGRKMLEIKCPACGKIFYKEKRCCYYKRLVFCSRNCIGKIFNLKRIPTEKEIEKMAKGNIIREFVGA